MTQQEILNIINNGEGLKIEFKKSLKKLPNNLFETVCAFLNTVGGTILLGVSDDSEIIGIEKKEITKLKKEIANLSNNPQKLDPVFMLIAQEFEINNKFILIVEVPESSMVHKTNKDVFVRNEDGDFKIIHLEKIADVVNRKKNYFSEQTVYSNVGFDDFDPNLIQRAKNLIRLNSSEHPWLELKDKEFFSRAGFHKKSIDGNEGYTLSAVLFFGTDELIHSIVPAYKFDALVRKFNVDRYDDRLTVRTNLLNAYDLLMGFIEKHINDPFYLEGTIRISLRSKIFRELVANIIAHREYLNASPAVITIFKNKIEFTNPNNPKEHGLLDPSHFTPFAKNPIISKFMLQLGRVEEVGSGMKNVYKYLPDFSKNSKAEFIDDDFFSTVVYLETVEKTVEKSVGKTVEKILQAIKDNPKITGEELSKETGLTKRGIEWNLAKLKEKGNLKRIGSDRAGHWQISDNLNISRENTRLTVGKTVGKILKAIKNNPKITREDLSKETGLSIRGVEWNLAKLKEDGKILRIGPGKGGHWQIINKTF